jgi:FO synthase
LTPEIENSKTAVETADDRLDEFLARGADGRSLTREQALALMAHADLPSLLEAASSLRDAAKGRVITFSRKVFIPLTTLCRDHCGYCVFRRDPGDPGGQYMEPEEVLQAVRSAQAAGCKEALFSLGDQPERVFPEAREFLNKRGFQRTLEYLAAMTERILTETGLLPHANPGVMGRDDLALLKASNASLGLMLENVSPRLLLRGGAHWRAPDKAPRVRLETIREAGRLQIPFTTGILIGIGETRAERVDSLLAIREMHETYGHIQEVIVQNFRAKSSTPMAGHLEPPTEEILRSVAVARLILGGEINLQAPPNLSAPDYVRLLEAGINDWGGVSPVTRDFINPEAAWPAINQLQEQTVRAGFTLRERLAIYPEFIQRPGFVHTNVRAPLDRMADPSGLARNGVCENERIP